MPVPSTRSGGNALAEAATWLARLHADDKSAADVSAFQVWLGESDAHRDAFAAVTASWELAGAVEGIPREEHGPSRRAVLMAAGIACGTVALGTTWWSLARQSRPETYASAVGEIRHVTLSDGSRLVLDTDTIAHVTIEEHARNVVLASGRAHVDVAHDPSRPFSVQAGPRQVVARGTSFDVSIDGADMTVLLTHGMVDVIDGSGERTALVPGQRLRARAGTVRIDQPDLATEDAWQSGRLVFDSTTLADAVKDMNRYDRRKIIIPDNRVGAIRISGAYVTGDTRSFARSLSDLLNIRSREIDGRIFLSALSAPTEPPLPSAAGSPS